MRQVGMFVVCRHIAGNIERLVGQVAWKTRIGLFAVHHCWQAVIDPAIFIQLRIDILGAGAIGAGKSTKQVVKAAVFQIDHHNMLQFGQIMIFCPASSRM